MSRLCFGLAEMPMALTEWIGEDRTRRQNPMVNNLQHSSAVVTITARNASHELNVRPGVGMYTREKNSGTSSGQTSRILTWQYMSKCLMHRVG